MCDGVRDSLESSFLPHVLGAEVGVAPGSVPVSRDGLGVEGRDQAEVFAHSM